MKKSFLLVKTLILLVTLCFLGCKKDPCEENPCANGGTCLEGACDCPTGYSGLHCEINDCLPNCENGTCNGATCECDPGYEGIWCDSTLNSKFFGNFTLTETCFPAGTRTYSVLVSGYAFTPMQVNFTSLNNTTYTCYADINSNGRDFIIPSQTFSGGSGSISGSGSLTADNNTLNIYYTSGGETCNATLTRL